MNTITQVKHTIATTAVKEFFAFSEEEFNELSPQDKKYIDNYIGLINKEDALSIIEESFTHECVEEIEHNIFMLKKLQAHFSIDTNDIMSMGLEEKFSYQLILHLMGEKELKVLVNERVQEDFENFFDYVYFISNYDKSLTNLIESLLSERNKNKWVLMYTRRAGQICSTFEEFREKDIIQKYIKKYGSSKLMKELIIEHGDNQGFYSPNYYHPDINSYVNALESFLELLSPSESENIIEINRFIGIMVGEINNRIDKQALIAIEVLGKYLNDCPVELKKQINKTINAKLNQLEKKGEKSTEADLLFEKLCMSLFLSPTNNISTTLKI